MASQLFKFSTIQAKELQEKQFFDIQGDGKLAIYPVKVYRAVITGKVMIVTLDHELLILEENHPLFVLRKHQKNGKTSQPRVLPQTAI